MPGARLTYGAYLMHPVIIKLLAGSMDDYYQRLGLRAMDRRAKRASLDYTSALWTPWHIPAHCPSAYRTALFRFGASDLFYRLVGNIMLSFFAAYWVFVLVERPMMSISALMMDPLTGRKKEATATAAATNSRPTR